MWPEDPLPSYDQLPLVEGGARSAWGLFGDKDEAGLVNLQTPACRVAAAALVETGETFPLNARADQPAPPLFGRGAVRHRRLEPREDWYFDDAYDGVFPQASSQWDALGHIGYRPNEFYNGATAEQVRAGERNTTETWAKRGIVGRGILLDLQRTAPHPYDPASSHTFGIDDLERARRHAGVQFRPGDVLVLHTGFLGNHARSDADVRARQSARSELTAAGLEHTEEMARYLWNTHASAVAADNPTVEVWPPDESPQAWPFGYLHYVLIGQLGLALGELWWVEELAAACASDGRYEFFFVSSPTNVQGAVGSQANAIALR